MYVYGWGLMNAWYDENSVTRFSFWTSGLQAFVGMSAVQGETRCEALEGLKIITNGLGLFLILIDPNASI